MVEDVHGNNLEQADVRYVVVLGNRCGKGDLSDARGYPWMSVEEAETSIHLFHSPDDDASEQMIARTGDECDACKGEMMKGLRVVAGLVYDHFAYFYREPHGVTHMQG